MSLEIHVLAPHEWPEYRELRLEALEHEPQAFGSSYQSMVSRPDEYFEDRLRQVKTGGDNRLLFARSQENLVGMIGSSRMEGTQEHTVNAFYVRKTARGQGIGKALLKELLTQIAADDAAETITLHVNKSQPDAIRIYESAGFQIVSELQDQMGDAQTHTLVAMSLNLK